jgi:plasmid maintenance system antidote protein VapI
MPKAYRGPRKTWALGSNNIPALRFARVFNTISAYWMDMQVNFDRAFALKMVDAAAIEPLVAAELRVFKRRRTD